MVAAPYGSTGSGYLLRTVSNYNVTWSGTGLTAGDNTASFYVAWTPSAAQLHMGVAATGLSPSMIFAPTVTDWPVRETSTVRRFRAVAACIKWIPTGPYSKRSGEVGSGYVAGQAVSTGGAWAASNAMSQCLKRAPNGSCPHEARWLPTIVDSEFVTVSFSDARGGTVFLAGLGVDGVQSTTNGVLNGYVEVTTIWEWEPVADNSAGTSSINVTPTPPAPFTLNDYLPRIKNIGAFVADGIGALAQSAGGPLGYTVARATSYVSSVLTGGVKQVRRGAPAMLTY